MNSREKVTERDDGVPSKGLFHDRVDVGERGKVIERRQSRVVEHAINLLLSLDLDMRV